MAKKKSKTYASHSKITKKVTKSVKKKQMKSPKTGAKGRSVGSEYAYAVDTLGKTSKTAKAGSPFGTAKTIDTKGLTQSKQLKSKK